MFWIGVGDFESADDGAIGFECFVPLAFVELRIWGIWLALPYLLQALLTQRKAVFQEPVSR